MSCCFLFQRKNNTSSIKSPSNSAPLRILRIVAPEFLSCLNCLKEQFFNSVKFCLVLKKQYFSTDTSAMWIST